ncbi:hypothetical protein [Georgenia yuyongxinii]
MFPAVLTRGITAGADITSASGSVPLDLSWAQIIGFAVTLIVGTVGGQWLGNLITTRAERNARVDAAVASQSREAQDCLNDLARACRKRNETGKKPDDHQIAALADAFEAAASRILSTAIVQDARTYIDVAQAYASGDPDVGSAAERRAYRAVIDGMLREHLSKRKR